MKSCGFAASGARRARYPSLIHRSAGPARARQPRLRPGLVRRLCRDRAGPIAALVPGRPQWSRLPFCYGRTKRPLIHPSNPPESHQRACACRHRARSLRSPPAAPPQSRLRSAATHRSRRRRRSPRRGRPQAVPSAKRGGGAQTAGAGSRQTRATGRSCESSISRPARPAAAAAASAPRTVAAAPTGACASRLGACAVRRRTRTSRCNCAASAERARSCRSPSRSTGTSPPAMRL